MTSVLCCPELASKICEEHTLAFETPRTVAVHLQAPSLVNCCQHTTAASQATITTVDIPAQPTAADILSVQL